MTVFPAIAIITAVLLRDGLAPTRSGLIATVQASSPRRAAAGPHPNPLPLAGEGVSVALNSIGS